MYALQGRWLECRDGAELSFEIILLESQNKYLFSRSWNGQSAITGNIIADPNDTARWTATLSDDVNIDLKLVASGNSQEDVLLLSENGQTGSSTARRIIMSQEWKAIVQQPVASGETMGISAAPGSGKTTALREWCRGQPDRKILFLAFSKSVQTQQERNFTKVAHVEVRTIHSIAYEATMTQRWSIGELSKTAVKDACGVNWDKAETIQTEMLRFLTSALPAVKFSEHVQNLWARTTSGHMRISHDGYLKQFQLMLSDKSSSVLPAALQGFDTIVLDEAQDCSDAMLDIFACLQGMAKVCAYDIHQNISQFRGVTSTAKLQSMSITYLRRLPQSQRFGPEIGKLLTEFIRRHKLGNTRFEVEGDEGKNTKICRVSGVEDALRQALSSGRLAANGRPQLTVLARKNSTLFKHLAAVVRGATAQRLFIVGGWSSFREQVLEPVLDICHLGAGKYAEIKDAFVGRYSSLDKFRFVVTSQEMSDWLVKLEIYDAFGQSFPKLLDRIHARFTDTDYEADVIFSTVHKAKGLGWPCVLLLDDFLAGATPSRSVAEEEVNICYVALSRVSTGTLYLTFDPLKQHSSSYNSDDEFYEADNDGFKELEEMEDEQDEMEEEDESEEQQEEPLSEEPQEEEEDELGGEYEEINADDEKAADEEPRPFKRTRH